jgi:PAS domain S-box-containing protein
MNTDRNLLFGVLALQADLIDNRQFVEICSLWTTRKHVPLADLLIQRGWILPGDKEHVDYLLERKLHKHGNDPRGSLATVGDDIKCSLAAIADPDIQRSLAELPKPKSSDLVATVDHVPEPRPRYRRTSLHAIGGIGRVWLAHDSDLGRDVALKEIRPERSDDLAHRARFLQEARITGQLEHPGVVPVYELSRGEEDGQPYYTMRFVKGRTLSEAAQTYHDKRQAGQTDTLDLLKLLNAFVAICNTVAYAHSRGVVHRDLKGQNVVLGDFGEVVVLDWGLAKRMDCHDADADMRAADREAEELSRIDLTVQGQALGTPAYMAPEQAAGCLDLIGPRTDVYGLGAMLYEILTGQPPFRGSDTHEVLRRVRDEQPIQPHQVCPASPPELEAICLRALAKRPEDRWSEASELAQQVEHWLAESAERKLADQQRARFFALSLDLMCNAGFDGYFKQLNPAWEKMLGWTIEELQEKPWIEFVHPEDSKSTLAAAEKIIGGEALLFHENRYLCKDGSYRWLQWTAQEIVGEHLIYAVARDITDRKLAEEELRKSQERFELAVLGSQDGLWDWDMRSNEVYFSPRYKSMLGFAEEEFPSRLEEWEKRLHPEDRERVEAAIRDHLAGSTPHYELEHRMRHKDGSYRWILARGVALRDAAGEANRMAGSHEDITERKSAEEALRASEERYRSIIAAMQDGIVLLDTDGSIRACNASAERILGLSADQIMGRTPSDPRWRAIHEDGTPFPGEMHPPMITLRTGQPCSNVVMGVHKPDDRLTWISINSQPLFTADGTTLCGVVASFEDITDRKETEERLQRTAEELASYKEQSRRPAEV